MGDEDETGEAVDLAGASAIDVVVPDHPFFAGTTMREDAGLLSSLARSYRREHGDGPVEMTRFLFSYVPVTLFDRVYATGDPARELPVGSYLWLFHLSGYFGGVWLRAELVRTGKNDAIAAFSAPQDEAGFRAEVAKADAALRAASGPGEGVLEYARASLFDRPPPPGAAQPDHGLVDTFGYNQGYLLQILDEPPEGLTAPADLVACPADPATRPLSCRYATTRLRALQRFDPVSEALAAGGSGYEELSTQIPPLQCAGIARGRQVWDGALNVQGFSQEAYGQLVDISSAFLETVQATALAAVCAVGDEQVVTGRQAATANALLGVWLTSYLTGMTDGRPDRALPVFGSR
jgi:hypothetical protein